MQMETPAAMLIGIKALTSKWQSSNTRKIASSGACWDAVKNATDPTNPHSNNEICGKIKT